MTGFMAARRDRVGGGCRIDGVRLRSRWWRGFIQLLQGIIIDFFTISPFLQHFHGRFCGCACRRAILVIVAFSVGAHIAHSSSSASALNYRARGAVCFVHLQFQLFLLLSAQPVRILVCPDAFFNFYFCGGEDAVHHFGV